MFSCRTRGFSPSCHAKRLEEWGEWMREALLLEVPHRQVVFTIPKMLRLFFKYKRRLLGDLCRCALRSLTRYFEVVTGSALTPGVIAAIQTFGDRINLHPHLHFLVTEGGVDEAGVFHKIARIDDSRLAEIFAREVPAFLVGRELLSPEWAERIHAFRHTGFNVHSLVRAKTKPEADAGRQAHDPAGAFAGAAVIPGARGQGWLSLGPGHGRSGDDGLLIRKVYEVDPMVCPKCGGTMKIIAFITEYASFCLWRRSLRRPMSSSRSRSRRPRRVGNIFDYS
ncbi:MAG: transposase [Candidatus Aminicenantales bacterium]